MCRASEAFKTEVLKNAYKKIWTKNSNLIVKNKHNNGLKNSNFEFLDVVGQFKLKKKWQFFFFEIFDCELCSRSPKHSFVVVLCLKVCENSVQNESMLTNHVDKSC